MNAAMARVHERFADAEPELANGYAEHATMGAEAMLTLGLDPAAVVSWAFQHEPVPVPEGSQLRVVRDSIAAELRDGDWRVVLRMRAGDLVDRLDRHLFHGLIRTAHAVRALERRDGAEARAELAMGLAAWRSWAGPERHAVTPSAAADPLAEVLEFARRGAAAFAAKPSIFTLHAVTAPMDYLLIADHLDESVHVVAAGLFANTHKRHVAVAARADDRPAPSPELLAGLLHRWDAHPAKLVEAALRGRALSGDAAFGDAVAAMIA
jgi:hypothetical protein